jgi:threonine dehydrogenase-like Zn-dependent dehydrogenase
MTIASVPCPCFLDGHTVYGRPVRGCFGRKLQKGEFAMKAIAVYPGKPNSMHLEEIPMPKVTDIPHGQGVLVKVLRVGVDGTDKEINAAEYGMAPEGYNFLITGHENFGQVLEVGPNVPDTIRPGTYVVATVRRPGHSICLSGENVLPV